MEARFLTWKNNDIFVKNDGTVGYYNPKDRKWSWFDSLKEAFRAVNQIAEQPESLWDAIKRAVYDYKQKSRVYSGTYLGDDDRGIDNECRLDLYFDAVYDFLRECKCLHLVFPKYYNCRDEAI